MNVNIFGVGRSGTKLVHLYTCLAAIEAEGSCVVSYEPFLWRSRRCLRPYPPGVSAHRRLPMLIEDPRSGMKHVEQNGFLAGLGRLGEGRTIVAKYIRANGRIPLVEGLGRSTKIVFVFRELPGVLRSIQGKSWDLLGAALARFGLPNDWERLTHEIRRLPSTYPYQGWLKHIDETNRLDRNAFYWAVMNHHALTKLRARPDKLLIGFNDLTADANVALCPLSDYLGWPTLGEDFRSISGMRIHDDSMITTRRWKHVHEVFDFVRAHPTLLRLYQRADRKLDRLAGKSAASPDLPIETVCGSPRPRKEENRHRPESGTIEGEDKPIYRDLNHEVVELFQNVRR